MCLAFCLVLGKLRTKVTVSSALAGYRGDKTAVFQDQQLPELSISGSAMHVHAIVTLSVKRSQTHNLLSISSTSMEGRNFVSFIDCCMSSNWKNAQHIIGD